MDGNAATVSLRALRTQLGLSQAELGRRWGVSDRMIRKLETGAVPGERYRESIRELARGVAAPPQRRTTVAGDLVRVRAKGGGTRTPEAAPPLPKRGAFGVQAGYLPNGKSATVITAPRSEGVGRERGRQAILDELAHHGAGHVALRVHSVETNRDYVIGAKGGYRADTLRRRMIDEGADPYAHIADILDGMGYDVAAGSLVSVTVIYL